MDEIEFNINHIVGFPKLKDFSIYQLLPLKLMSDIDLTDLIPKDLPVVNVPFDALHIEAISPELLTSLNIHVPVPPTIQITSLALCGRFILGTLSILLANLLHSLVELIYLLFNVAIVWKSLIDLPYVSLPTLLDIQLSLEAIIGPFSRIVYMIEDFFGYLNFFKAISWSNKKNFLCLFIFSRLWGDGHIANPIRIFIWVRIYFPAKI
jgi:hypothetical protein